MSTNEKFEKSEQVKLSDTQKFNAAHCAVKCWDEAGGNFTEAERLFRRRHGGCESVLIWIQLAAALLQIAYTIWKWRKDNQSELLQGDLLERLLIEAEENSPVPFGGV